MAERPPAPAGLLPHRPPMILLDKIIADRADAIEVQARIDASHPFFEAGRGVLRDAQRFHADAPWFADCGTLAIGIARSLGTGGGLAPGAGGTSVDGRCVVAAGIAVTGLAGGRP